MSIFDEDEVKIYDRNYKLITVSKKEIMKGRRYTESGLWRVLLISKVKNINTETVLV